MTCQQQNESVMKKRQVVVTAAALYVFTDNIPNLESYGLSKFALLKSGTSGRIVRLFHSSLPISGDRFE
jgi:hypothetical protein